MTGTSAPRPPMDHLRILATTCEDCAALLKWIEAQPSETEAQFEMPNAIWLAKFFHDTYERLAPEYGYETRTETRVFDRESENGRLMIAVCEELRRTLDCAPSPNGSVAMDDYKALYMDLLMEVAKKHPGESRHATAKRYITERENQPSNAAQGSQNER